MKETEAFAVIEKAIEYVLFIRDSSGEDNGETDLARSLEEALVTLHGKAEPVQGVLCERCGRQVRR